MSANTHQDASHGVEASTVETTMAQSASESSAASDSVTSVTATLDKLPNTPPPTEAAPVATSATTEPAKAEEGGLPQLNTGHWPGQMLWLVIIFTVFYLSISKVFAPRLRKAIDTRGSTIAEDLANARAIRDEAEAQAKQAADDTLAAQTEARKLAAEAKARVAAETAKAAAEEDAKLNIILSEAEARIRASRDAAMAHVEEIATDTASSLIEKLTGKAPTKTQITSALKKA